MHSDKLQTDFESSDVTGHWSLCSSVLYTLIWYIPSPGKKMKTLIWKDTCTPLFIALLFTTAKKWKQPVSTNRWMDKNMCIYIHTHTHTHTHTMEYYSAIKMNEILSFAKIWIDLEDIMLREISQIKTNTVCYPLYVGI